MFIILYASYSFDRWYSCVPYFREYVALLTIKFTYHVLDATYTPKIKNRAL